MADNFTAEKTDSGDQLFATDQNAADSVHYPIGKIAWGALNTFNITSTSSPFPIRVYGNDSFAPVHITTDSGTPPTVRISNPTDTTVTVSNPTDTSVTITTSSSAPLFVTTDSGAPPTVTVSNPNDTTITVSNISGNDTTVTVTTSSSAPLFITTDSGTPPVVSVTNIADNDTTMTVSNDSSDPIGVTNDSANAIFVRGVGSSNVITELSAANSTVGGLVPYSAVTSSAIDTIASSKARLYGWYITNPDTANFVYLKMFSDDSAGVTKGTTAATINLGIPPQGGANVFTAQGMHMSSGISVLAAGGSGLTDTSAPSTSLVVNVFYAGNS